MNVPEIQTILRSLSEDNTPKIKEIFDLVKKDINKNDINIGYLKAERGIGKAVDEFYSVAENLEGIHLVDTPLLIDEIIQTKDKEELNLMNISSKFSCCWDMPADLNRLSVEVHECCMRRTSGSSCSVLEFEGDMCIVVP